eukprot:TRINITY_DN6845_c0_g1_i1.p1 TRINITY_DN6845_c0_g1~~TRINITY_DN6845_c0_g1_i1.p1  ORF type:complete len:1223 (+),score=199.98 TRINITY_DN6845_c0_g1_i1:128-3796(+)
MTTQIGHVGQISPRNAVPGLKALTSPAFVDVWNHFLSHVFDLDELWRSTGSSGIRASLSNISDLIDARTKTIPVPPGPPASHQHDRAGPPHVTLTTSTSCNSWNQDVNSMLLLSEDLLEVQNRKEFASIFASVSVCRGKWQYEATIITSGIMQIGWMNPTLSFEKHDGVGDEYGSFAFDGGRRKKWGEGLSTASYGQFWTTGDVVGCLLDLDNKTVSFTLNGINLGEAWNEIPTSSFYAPAVTLADSEQLRFNFGATPLRFPAPGYSVLESRIESSEDRLAPLLLQYYAACLKRLLPHLVSGSFVDASGAFKPMDPSLKLSNIDGTMLLATLFSKLSPLLTNTYAVSFAIVPLLLDLATSARSSLTKLIDVINEICDPDECEKLWRACVGFFADAATKESYHNIIQDVKPHDPNAAAASSEPQQHHYREIAVFLLSNRRVLKHVYRWSRFPLIMEQIFNVTAPSRSELQQLFPNPWWPETSEPFSSLPLMKRSLNKLQEYFENIDNVLLGFVRSLLADVEALDPLPSTTKPWSPEQRILSNMGKNSISNWLDFSTTMWNSPASIFLLWASCWIQNRKPRLGKNTDADQDADSEPNASGAPSPRVLDSLFAVLCAFLARQPCLQDRDRFLKESNVQIEHVAPRSAAFWNIADCVGGDLGATRRALSALYPDQNIGLDSAPPAVSVMSSVIRVCAMLFPDRALRIDLDTIVESTRTRSKLNSSLKALANSFHILEAHRQYSTHVQELVEQTRCTLVALVRQHAVATVSCYSPNKLKHLIDFGNALVWSFSAWISDDAATARELFKLVPLDILRGIQMFWTTVYPLILLESFDSSTPGSALFPETAPRFHQLGIEICSALCAVVSDSRVFNPQERHHALSALILLINKAEISIAPEIVAPSFVVSLGKALLVAFTKEQTSPAASQLLSELWAGSKPLAVSFRKNFVKYVSEAEPDSEESKLFADFTSALVTRLNFNFTELLRGAADVQERENAFKVEIGSPSGARDDTQQSLVDAWNRCIRHTETSSELLSVARAAINLRPIAFTDKVNGSVLINPLYFLIDRITASSSALFSLNNISGMFMELLSGVVARLSQVLDSISEHEVLSEQFVATVCRSHAVPISGFEQLITQVPETSPGASMLRSLIERMKNGAAEHHHDGAAGDDGNDDEQAAEEELCPICCSEPVDTVFKPCGHQSCGVCIRRQLSVKSTCFMCNQVVDSLQTLK